MVDTSTRRSDVRSKIVDVAARLLREHGPAAVTTRGVAEAAGVQAPTIYRLFGDKDGLLDAVAEHVMTVQVAAKAAVVEAATEDDVDPLDDLGSGWAAQIDFGLANPSLFRLLSDPDRALHSPAAQTGRRVLEARVHRVALTGRLRVSEQRAVQMIQAAGVGAILTLLSTPTAERDSGVAAAMYEAVLRQVLTDAPDAPDAPDAAGAGSMGAAVALRAVAPGLDVLSEGERRLLTEWLDRVVASGE